MQCQPVRCSPITFPDNAKMEKEIIHSGHFMVSHFEAEAQDDEYEVAVPVPEPKSSGDQVPQNYGLQVFNMQANFKAMPPGQLAIETSLTKLFQCMSLAYRQKLTSPKWNRFKGIRLRWKDKIRLNNVIWRCWHMQFIKKENTLICQFASPLDEGIHNKPEAVVLEGKYWKRKLAAVTAEYKKWRMFYRNKIMGWAGKDYSFQDLEIQDWMGKSTDNYGVSTMMVDEDYMDLMSDTLFSTISSNQPFAFPDIREITRGANLADFIQPSLVQLQPNLDEIMDLEPLHEYFPSKLPPVPEECAVADMTYRPLEMEVQNPSRPTSEAVASTSTVQPSNSAQYQYTEATPPKTSRYYTREQVEQPVDQSIANYTYSDSSTIKTARVYLPKADEKFQFTNKSPDKDGRVLMEGFSYDGDLTRVTVSYGHPSNAVMPQRNYKVAATAVGTTPVQQNYGYSFQKIAPAPPSSVQYTRVQSYDLATCIPDSSPVLLQKGVERSASLPSVEKDDVFVVPKQHMSLKNKHRSRSGSSLLSTNTKTRSHPPPLLSSSSDPNLNVHKSALLAQLLTTAAPTMYNVTTSTKTGNVPILPMHLSRVQPVSSLPINTGGTLLIASGTLAPTPSQSYITMRHPTSPESSVSSPESSRGQQVSSPGLAGPPTSTSPLLYGGGPVSPKRGDGTDRNKSSPQPTDHRRACHINAEQKRRFNIKNGFDMLHSLIPHLQQNPSVKLSKAAMLQKGAEYIKQLQSERIQAKEEIEGLRHQIECLNSTISNCQALLPATGAPISRHRTTRMRESFDEMVRVRTLENWRFWIFSRLFESLLTTFNGSVSTASYEDLYRSTLMWVERHCSLVELRQAVLTSLCNLSKTTDILTDPQKLPEEARAAVSRRYPQGGS